MNNLAVIGLSTTSLAAGRANAEVARHATGNYREVHLHSEEEPQCSRPSSSVAAEAPRWSVGGDHLANSVLQQTLARMRVRGISVEEHAPKGDPANGIVAVAARENADLIVVGSKGMQGARRVLGSVPNKVSHQSPCDLLIVQTD